MVAQLPAAALPRLLARYRIGLAVVADGAEIPASYWGAPEAGVSGTTVHARADTPVHSVLHTASHIVCMDPGRRARLYRDCGGDDAEEAAVCYLQCLLAECVDGYSRARLFADMDAWGYSFRLGNARAWFEQDAADARAWLLALGLIDGHGRLTFRLR
jgi:hypothetical protein